MEEINHPLIGDGYCHDEANNASYTYDGQSPFYIGIFVQDPVAQWDYERLESNFQSFREFESRRECKNLFIRYSQINFCLDTKIYFASSALASTVIRLFGRGTSFQFRAFSALVVLNYSYCCPDCGVRIELACLF